MMGGGIRQYCPKCNKKLKKSSRRCLSCGWNYDKEWGGQQELNKLVEDKAKT